MCLEISDDERDTARAVPPVALGVPILLRHSDH
jgi:hypothetical protein